MRRDYFVQYNFCWTSTDEPLYRTGVTTQEAGPGGGGGTAEGTSCNNLILVAISAVCCLVCYALCKKKDGEGQQSTAPNPVGPLASGCLASLCANQMGANTTRTSNNRNYNSVDHEIISEPPEPTRNHGRMTSYGTTKLSSG